MVDEAIVELNACDFLFLAEIEELEHNGLRLVVREGRRAGAAEPLRVGDALIAGGARIAVTAGSLAFELIWRRYVAYSVMNESFAAADEGERYTGNRFRVYEKSHFIDYVLRTWFASDGYPGPTRHVAVICENHIIDVISEIAPAVQRIPRPAP